MRCTAPAPTCAASLTRHRLSRCAACDLRRGGAKRRAHRLRRQHPLPSLNRLAGLLDPVHGRRWLRAALDAAAEISRPATLDRARACHLADGRWRRRASARSPASSASQALPYGPARSARCGHSAPSPLTTADRRLVCVRLLLDARACAAPGAPSVAACSAEAGAKRLADGAAGAQ